MVAPYEADAQLAYLEKEGIIDAVITEDSDLLVFGCNRVLFKLEPDGRLIEVKRENFTRSASVKMHDWSMSEFRQMAILSGCDYLPSIPGLGLKKAHQLLRQYRTPDRVVSHIRFQGQPYGKVPDGYLAEFRRAELTFLHQRVFDPRTQRMTLLSPVPSDYEDVSTQKDFIGAFIDDEAAAALARGDLDPISRMPMEDICPDTETSGAPREAVDTKPTSFYRAQPKKEKTIALIPGQAALTRFFAAAPSRGESSSAAIRREPQQEVAGDTRSATMMALATPQQTRKSKFFAAGESEKTPIAAAAAPRSATDPCEKYWGATGAWTAQNKTPRLSPDAKRQIEMSSPISDKLKEEIEFCPQLSSPCSQNPRSVNISPDFDSLVDGHEGLISSPPTSPTLQRAASGSTVPAGASEQISTPSGKRIAAALPHSPIDEGSPSTVAEAVGMRESLSARFSYTQTITQTIERKGTARATDAVLSSFPSVQFSEASGAPLQDAAGISNLPEREKRCQEGQQPEEAPAEHLTEGTRAAAHSSPKPDRSISSSRKRVKRTLQSLAPSESLQTASAIFARYRHAGR